VRAKSEKKSLIYQVTVTATGLSLWLFSALSLLTHHAPREQLIMAAFVPLIIVISLFPNSFPLPSSLKYEKITFTLSDAFVFLVACWYGTLPAVFLAGAEAFVSSRRSVRRLSSNLFSAGMISLAAAAAAVTLNATLSYGFHEPGLGFQHSFLAITVALLPATAVHVLVNVGLLSALSSLRTRRKLWPALRENLAWAAPIALPTNAVASLAYLALQYNPLIMVLIGGPILAAINFGHRQYRNNMHQRIELLEKGHRETIEALAVAINAKDEVTHEHVQRVQIYAAGVARLLGCSDEEIEALKAGALLHDIGKIAVPDYILNKPGKLTVAEFDKMKLHTIVGAQILGRVDFHYPVVPIVRHHHERWDGKGYPDGLAGEAIPLTARILTVVDCFDALRGDRQYRRGLTREEATDFLLKNSGSQYDPRVVGIFLTHLPEFEAEIAAHKGQPVPTFGIEPVEQLSEAAQQVAPAAGLAQSETASDAEINFSRQELGQIYELVQTLNGAGSRDDLLRLFADKLSSMVAYDTCSLSMIAEDTGEIVVRHANGLNADLLEGRSITLGEGITGWVIANREAFCNSDPRLDFPIALADNFAHYRTLAAIPIGRQGNLHGAVTVYSCSLGEYSKDQQKLLKEAVAVLADALSIISQKSATSANQTLGSAAVNAMPALSQESIPNPAQAQIESELTH
jgi:putative nucleotidyltransferase with HDIG domain